ncbi:MAG: FecR family protein [Candidatus Eremiobacteraeota bacterium]|nr:FecR family protein [Candidatus Eremiobacteraeota bacterium]
MMPYRSTSFVLFLIAALILLSGGMAPSFCQQDFVGKITSLVQNTEIVRAEAKYAVPALEGNSPGPGDVLRTGEGGRCELTLSDGSQIILNSRSSLLIRRRDLFILQEGQLWASFRAEARATVDSPCGQAATRETVSEFVMTLSKDHRHTAVELISGELHLSTPLGTIKLTAPQKGMLSLSSPPSEDPSSPSQDSGAESPPWTAFRKQSIIVLVKENEKGRGDRFYQQDLEKTLRQGRFGVLTGESLMSYRDQAIQALKGRAMKGELSAAMDLCRKTGIDLLIMASVTPVQTRQISAGIVSCAVKGEVRLYQVSTGELLISSASTATGTGKNEKEAASDAIRTIRRNLVTSLPWEVRRELAERVRKTDIPERVEIVLIDFTAQGKKALMEKLRKMAETMKVSDESLPGRPAFILMTTASVKTLSRALTQVSGFSTKVVEATGERIVLKAQKRN